MRPLTDHQLQILALIADGRTHQEIALRLQRSPSTVRNPQGTIYRKLGVRSGPHAVAVGFREGLLR